MIPQVSVIMPVFNGERFIADSIMSILNQTFNDFELIIVDDCSTDNTVSIIKEIKDGRIRYVRNFANSGPAISRNVGNSMARGKYIAVIDADDIALPHRLASQFHYLESHPKIGLSGSFGEAISADGSKIGLAQRPTN
jgi:glycosyltransferase involved in cell wall biosynthesis